MKVDNVLKQPVDDSFCLNPLELERIVESLKKGASVFLIFWFVRLQIKLIACIPPYLTRLVTILHVFYTYCCTMIKGG